MRFEPEEEDTSIPAVSIVRGGIYPGVLFGLACIVGDQFAGLKLLTNPSNSALIGAGLVMGAFLADCFYSLRGKLVSSSNRAPRPIKWQFQPTLEMLAKLAPIALIHAIFNTPPWLDVSLLLGISVFYYKVVVPNATFLQVQGYST
ncbi:hypothetical protein [Helicobacter sp. L8]|uniref:hypothetical protein n=1 Tax=Helicobacter sp. L8 TaxID=2316078 RepID=UPI000EB22AB4|nr:hypothetical protein [Helicobacter sp. L8]